MIYVLMQRHGGKNLLLAEYDRIYANSMKGPSHRAVYRYCFDTLHPEEQVKAAKKLVAEQMKYHEESCNKVVLVNSLIFIYAMNNELLRHPKLAKFVEVYEVISSKKKVSVIKDGWIDESVLGHVSEELYAEMNKLVRKKKKQ